LLHGCTGGRRGPSRPPPPPPVTPPPPPPAPLSLRVAAQKERTKRLAKFMLLTMRAQKRVEQRVNAQVSLRHLHDTILACKLELFR
jgi:hypothetical protein